MAIYLLRVVFLCVEDYRAGHITPNCSMIAVFSHVDMGIGKSELFWTAALGHIIETFGIGFGLAISAVFYYYCVPRI